MSAPAAAASRPSAPALGTLRRFILYVLLFALVSLAASGLGGLLGRLFTASETIAFNDSSSLALWLALTLVGGPLGAVVFWASWRLLADPAERRAKAWGIYVAAMYVTSLVTATSFGIGALASLAGGDTGSWKTSLAQAVAWAGVWVWHRWLLGHRSRGPEALATLPLVLGTVLGLVIGLGAGTNALAVLFERALGTDGELAAIGAPWWRPGLGLLVWTAGGILIWWWHWVREGARALHTRLAGVGLVAIGVAGSALLALGGAGVLLYVLLRLGLDRTDPVPVLLEPGPEALAAALLGTLSWLYHGQIARARPAPVPAAAQLAISGIALAAAASGIGVVINAGLSTATTRLGGTDATALLLAGLSSLAVGGPLWWFFWGPTRPAEPHGRRIYLVLVFGISAVVALVTLLVIGFRLFEFMLGDAGGTGLLERVRAPLGLLVATGLVAGYHFALWRHDRASAPARRTAPAIGEVLLVAGVNAQDLAAAIAEHTGAVVTVLPRADGGTTALEAVLPALEGLVARRVLLLAGPGERVEAIELA
ncbi:hypothetical protein GCM10009715_11560 [Paeniglutamicibacter psychrophenolicus]|uniref:DUF5671 domain-containing protein n=1 Tax=Paeniglutamicibacter psychrophenolicus TaxID=257454 RepID=A0ABS4W7D3_9MICC|nr:DUF5671 domain-containing protein [Paeniglutamicibacter psychrophenolicus]MBP2372105.1 hypothetical protein [Paeniglutamicibacter psychrophenolicus]